MEFGKWFILHWHSDGMEPLLRGEAIESLACPVVLRQLYIVISCHSLS